MNEGANAQDESYQQHTVLLTIVLLALATGVAIDICLVASRRRVPSIISRDTKVAATTEKIIVDLNRRP